MFQNNLRSMIQNNSLLRQTTQKMRVGTKFEKKLVVYIFWKVTVDRFFGEQNVHICR